MTILSGGGGSIDDVALGLGEVGKGLAAEEESADQVDIDWFHKFCKQGEKESIGLGLVRLRAGE